LFHGQDVPVSRRERDSALKRCCEVPLGNGAEAFDVMVIEAGGDRCCKVVERWRRGLDGPSACIGDNSEKDPSVFRGSSSLDIACCLESFEACGVTRRCRVY
jgi:hypothetical protein